MNEAVVETQDGHPIKVVIEAQTGLIAGGAFGLVRDLDLVEKASAQVETDRSFNTYIQGAQIEQPPIPLDNFVTLANNNQVHMACCVTKATDTVGHGYTVRPRSVLFPRVADQGAHRDNAADASAQARVLDFLEQSWKHGESFTDVALQAALDMEIIGQGYAELARDTANTVSEVFSVKGVTVRIAAGGPTNGFWQVRGSKYQFFSAYKPGAGVAVKLGKMKLTDDMSIDIVEKCYSDPAFVMKARAGDEKGVAAVNELLMFSLPSSTDTRYGMPDVVPASGSVLVQRGIRDYRVTYFDNATIPRLIISCSGDVDVDAVTKKIISFLSTQKRVEVLNKVLILEVPEGVTVKIDELKQCRMDDGDALKGLDDHEALGIMMAHRVPERAIPAGKGGGAAGVGDVEIQRYIASVVRPRQRLMAERWNWVIREETGVRDWVLDFNAPSILTEEQKARIRDIAGRVGYMSINDMRQEDSRPPLVGGDEPILRSAGQPFVPLSQVNEIAMLIAQGASTKAVAAQAPPGGKCLYITDPRGCLPQMTDDDRSRLRMQLESLCENRDDVGKALGFAE